MEFMESEKLPALRMSLFIASKRFSYEEIMKITEKQVKQVFVALKIPLISKLCSLGLSLQSQQDETIAVCLLPGNSGQTISKPFLKKSCYASQSLQFYLTSWKRKKHHIQVLIFQTSKFELLKMFR